MSEPTDIPVETVEDEAVGNDFEYSCEVCGVELHYGGRGRKPKRCEDHKGRVSAKTREGKGTGRNSTLARQASAALSQVNGLVAMALLVAPRPYNLPRTASALADANEGFSEAAYNALLTDPKLCALILKAGSASGKVALVIAYSMLAGAVVPVGIEEYKANR